MEGELVWSPYFGATKTLPKNSWSQLLEPSVTTAKSSSSVHRGLNFTCHLESRDPTRLSTSSPNSYEHFTLPKNPPRTHKSSNNSSPHHNGAITSSSINKILLEIQQRRFFPRTHFQEFLHIHLSCLQHTPTPKRSTLGPFL